MRGFKVFSYLVGIFVTLQVYCFSEHSCQVAQGNSLDNKNIFVASMAIGEDYRRMMQPSYDNKLAYCNKHGHPLKYAFESLDTSRPIPWSKVLLILDIMNDDSVEWVFWTDADSLIMNDTITLTSIIDDSYDFILTKDLYDLNTGQFFIRNCEWSRDFLERIYDKEKFIFHPLWENAAIIDQLSKSKKDMAHVKVLPQRVMNSYAPEFFKDINIAYQKGDFIIHFAGVHGGELMNTLMIKYSHLTPNTRPLR